MGHDETVGWCLWIRYLFELVLIQISGNVLAIAKMMYGLFLTFSDHVNEGDMISVFWGSIHQLIFVQFLCGYMCFLIVHKWCIDWGTTSLPANPSLITVLIKMILSIGNINGKIQISGSNDTQMLIQEMLVLKISLRHSRYLTTLKLVMPYII